MYCVHANLAIFLIFYSVIGLDTLYLCYVLPVTSLELYQQRFDYSPSG